MKKQLVIQNDPFAVVYPVKTIDPADVKVKDISEDEQYKRYIDYCKMMSVEPISPARYYNQRIKNYW